MLSLGGYYEIVMKTIVITGASRGIGLATAKKFLADGWFVIGTSTSGVDSLNNANFRIVTLDYLDPSTIPAAVEEIGSLNRKVEVLFNNAGVVLPADRTDIDTLNVVKLRQTLEVNLVGTVDFTEQLLPIINPGGHIINVGSRSAILSAALEDDDTDAPAYRISKVAINMYPKLLSKRLETKEITVSSIDPGWVRTDMGGPNAERPAEEVAQEVYELATSKPETGQFWKSGEKRSW